MTARANGLTARVIAWHERDVFAVEIDDRRAEPAPVDIDLRMLRYAMQYLRGENFDLASRHEVAVETGAHRATSRLDIRDDCIVLAQDFWEDAH